jgi:dihydroorotate dehydrogenase
MSDDVGWYRYARRMAFSLDAETVHRVSMRGLALYSEGCRVELPTTDPARAPSLVRQVCGITFPNPLGLAAGFDKDAECLPAWQALGFGFVEVGTVTRHPQPGNDPPRLFRLPADGALLNRLGFNNHGAAACAARIEAWRRRGRVRVPLGINIGKSKITPPEDAAADYAFSFDATADVADYVVVNVSSPNTPGLRDLQQTSALMAIVDPLIEKNARRAVPRPIFVKLAPDLEDDDAVAIMRACSEHGVAGLVVSNTTISREGLVGPVPPGPGGISGRPLFARSTALLRVLKAESGGRLAFIGVGGVSDGQTAHAKLDAGADLIQAYTGFVYGGPGFARQTLRGLAAS